MVDTEGSRRYIYGLADPRDGRLRYIGKTKARPIVRARQHRGTAAVMPWLRLSQWIVELATAGYHPEVVILEVVDQSEVDAAERRWITRLIECGFQLVNSARTGQDQQIELEKRQFRATHVTPVPGELPKPIPPVPAGPARMTPDDIRLFRESLGWSQRQLAKALGHSNSTVSLWESGKREPPPTLRSALVELRVHHDLGEAGLG